MSYQLVNLDTTAVGSLVERVCMQNVSEVEYGYGAGKLYQVPICIRVIWGEPNN